MRGLHHSGGKHAPSAMSSASSSPNSDLKIVTMSLAKESESGTLGISIIGGKVIHCFFVNVGGCDEIKLFV